MIYPSSSHREYGLKQYVGFLPAELLFHVSGLAFARALSWVPAHYVGIPKQKGGGRGDCG